MEWAQRQIYLYLTVMPILLLLNMLDTFSNCSTDLGVDQMATFVTG